MVSVRLKVLDDYRVKKFIIFSSNNLLFFSGASGVNTIYTSMSPNGKYSDDLYTYDKSMEATLVLEVSKIKLD